MSIFKNCRFINCRNLFNFQKDNYKRHFIFDFDKPHIASESGKVPLQSPSETSKESPRQQEETKFNQGLSRIDNSTSPAIKALKKSFILTYTLLNAKAEKTLVPEAQRVNFLKNLNQLISNLLDKPKPPLNFSLKLTEWDTKDTNFTIEHTDTTPEGIEPILKAMQGSKNFGEMPTESHGAKAYNLIKAFHGSIPENKLSDIAYNYKGKPEKATAFTDLEMDLLRTINPKPDAMNDQDWVRLLKAVGYRPGQSEDEKKRGTVFAIDK